MSCFNTYFDYETRLQNDFNFSTTLLSLYTHTHTHTHTHTYIYIYIYITRSTTPFSSRVIASQNSIQELWRNKIWILVLYRKIPFPWEEKIKLQLTISEFHQSTQEWIKISWKKKKNYWNEWILIIIQKEEKKKMTIIFSTQMIRLSDFFNSNFIHFFLFIVKIVWSKRLSKIR